MKSRLISAEWLAKVIYLEKKDFDPLGPKFIVFKKKISITYPLYLRYFPTKLFQTILSQRIFRRLSSARDTMDVTAFLATGSFRARFLPNVLFCTQTSQGDKAHVCHNARH